MLESNRISSFQNKKNPKKTDANFVSDICFIVDQHDCILQTYCIKMEIILNSFQILFIANMVGLFISPPVLFKDGFKD